MRQSRAAESRPQLEAHLQRLLIIFLRNVFHDYGVVPFTNFAALLGLPLALIRDLDKSSRRRRLGDELHYVVLQRSILDEYDYYYIISLGLQYGY
jgi:ABC-type antimicrobial peptide transport system ATPase subunit